MMPFGSWLFPDAAEINALHAVALASYGGMEGILDKGCPEAKVAAAQNAVLYASDGDDEPDLLAAAAYLLVYLVQGHCYADGNKRVGWLAALHLLHLNGIGIRGDEAEAAQLVERVAQRKADVAEVQAWLGQPERLYAAMRG